MNTIVVAGLCGIAFAGGALLTLSLWAWAQPSKEPQTKRSLDLQERWTDQQDVVISQRDAQVEILKEIRDALKGGAK